MAIIPAGEKVLMTGANVNTVYGGSAALQEQNKWYTIEDIAESVGGGGGGSGTAITIEAIGGVWNYPGESYSGSDIKWSYTNIPSDYNRSFEGTKDLFSIVLPSWIWNGMNYSTQPTATSIIIRNTPLARFQLIYIQNLQSIEFADLEILCQGQNTYGNTQAAVNISYNPALTTLTFPKVKKINPSYWQFSSNAFSQTTVDYLINLFALYADQFTEEGYQMNPQLDVAGETNSAPSAGVLTDINTLASKGWYVQYN